MLPFFIIILATAIALAVESSQFDGYCSVDIGILSVCPSTWISQFIFLGILLVIEIKISAISSTFWIPSFPISADPDWKKTSDCNTNLSPTIFISFSSPIIFFNLYKIIV